MRRTLIAVCALLLLSSLAIAQEGREEPWANPAWITLGDIRLDMTQAEVLSILKKPARMGPKSFEGATGYKIQTWYYPRLGLELEMATEESQTPLTFLYRITAKAPCQWQAFNGIKIGSSINEARATAAQVRDSGEAESWDSPGEPTIIGMLWKHTHQVLSFNLRGGRVAEIFLGPGPE